MAANVVKWLIVAVCGFLIWIIVDTIYRARHYYSAEWQAALKAFDQIETKIFSGEAPFNPERHRHRQNRDNRLFCVVEQPTDAYLLDTFAQRRKDYLDGFCAVLVRAPIKRFPKALRDSLKSATVVVDSTMGKHQIQAEIWRAYHSFLKEQQAAKLKEARGWNG